jgi:urease accessory protein
MRRTGVLDRGPAIDHQRVRGEVRAAFKVHAGRTRLARLRHAGSARALLPATDGAPEVVLLNTAGGLTGGDVLDYSVCLDATARATVTTQAAERVYDCAGGTARMTVRLEVGRGGRLDWLPQETILFDRADLDRTTRIELSSEASCLALETLVFGRRAMGEVVRELRLVDRREIWRGGKPVLIEPLCLGGGTLAARPALLRGARAIASLVLVERGAAADRIPDICVDGVEASTSGWDGRLCLRAFAADALPLRRYLNAVLTRLRGGRLPTVWQT